MSRKINQKLASLAKVVGVKRKRKKKDGEERCKLGQYQRGWVTFRSQRDAKVEEEKCLNSADVIAVLKETK
jgi:uncharacterized protein YecT (DUF1311 family)